MTNKYIVPCVCIKYKLDSSVSVNYGMPILKITPTWLDNHGEAYNYYEAVCPRCGRGGLHQFKSAYLALRWWNNLMEQLWEERDFNGQKVRDYSKLPYFLDDIDLLYNEPQSTVSKELEEWR